MLSISTPFEPKGKYAWDLWFAFDGEKHHIYYLQADKAACEMDPGKRNFHATVGHGVLMSDGSIKDVCEDSVFGPSTTDNTWDNLSIWDGCVLKDPASGKYLMYYTAISKEDKPIETPKELLKPQNIGLAVSDDLVSWQRHPCSIEKPLIPNPGTTEHFDGVGWRDPFVTKIGDLYYCFLSARLLPNTKYNIESLEEGGSISYVASKDLFNWDCAKPSVLMASKHFYQMEVPQIYWKVSNGKKVYYLIFCAQMKDLTPARLKEMPREECLSGTYILRSEPMEPDSQVLPVFKDNARILAPGLYAGRLLDPERDQSTIYGFKMDPEKSDTYLGGIISQSVVVS